MKEYRFFDDSGYIRAIKQLRNQAKTDIEKLVAAYNGRQISKQEYERGRREYWDQVRQARAQIIRDRDLAINKAEIAYYNKLAGGQDVDRFSTIYNETEKIAPEKLERKYETALKIGDQVTMKAVALRAVEESNRKVVDDMAIRDPKWQDDLSEFLSFKQNVASQEAKFSTSAQHFSIIEPAVKHVSEQDGFVRDNTGKWQAHMTERLEIKG